MLPANVSKWEIAGVSTAPIVLALYSLGVPAMIGLDAEQFAEALAGLMAVMAIVRAVHARRTASSAA